MIMHQFGSRSSNLHSIGHDGVNTMRIKFHHGKQYNYSPVKPEAAQRIHDAASPGAELAKLGIKGNLYDPDNHA